MSDTYKKMIACSGVKDKTFNGYHVKYYDGYYVLTREEFPVICYNKAHISINTEQTISAFNAIAYLLTENNFSEIKIISTSIPPGLQPGKEIVVYFSNHEEIEKFIDIAPRIETILNDTKIEPNKNPTFRIGNIVTDTKEPIAPGCTKYIYLRMEYPEVSNTEVFQKKTLTFFNNIVTCQCQCPEEQEIRDKLIAEKIEKTSNIPPTTPGMH